MSAESTEEAMTAVTEDQEDSQEETQSKTASRLEEEGDIAADYLEELLDIADIDGDIDIEVRNGRTYISIGADEESAALDSLVGRDGEVLEACRNWPVFRSFRPPKAVHVLSWTSMDTARNAPAYCSRSPRMLWRRSRLMAARLPLSR